MRTCALVESLQCPDINSPRMISRTINKNAEVSSRNILSLKLFLSVSLKCLSVSLDYPLCPSCFLVGCVGCFLLLFFHFMFSLLSVLAQLEKHIPPEVFFTVELSCASNIAVLNSTLARTDALHTSINAFMTVG